MRKSDSLRFLSHHDMMRTCERVLRRTGLPLSMSEGFNPHPRYSLLWPTSVGMTSAKDYMEFELKEAIPTELVLQRLTCTSPPGLCPLKADLLQTLKPTPVESVEYVLVPPVNTKIDTSRLEEILSRDEWLVLRQKKSARKKCSVSRTINIRDYVLSLLAELDRIYVHIKITSQGTARPFEIIQIFGFTEQEVKLWKVIRKEVHLATVS